MFCSKCGTQLAEGAEFCSKCGTAVAVTPATQTDVYCANCGYKIAPHNTKCLHCGAARPDAPAAAVVAPKGIGCGQVALVVGGLICMLFLYRAFFGGPTPTTRSTRTVAPSSSGYAVTYRITGTASTVSLTINNASGNTEQIALARVPWERSFRSDGGFVYLSAQNQRESGSVRCEILVDGKVIEQADSSGAYTIASCSGSVR